MSAVCMRGRVSLRRRSHSGDFLFHMSDTLHSQEGGREDDEKCSNFKWEEKPRDDHHFFHLFLLSSEKSFVFDMKHINLQTSRADETQMLVICSKVMLKLICTSVEHFGRSAKWYLNLASHQTSAMISIRSHQSPHSVNQKMIWLALTTNRPPSTTL